MKLVFMGTPDFAVPSLEILAKSAHDIVLVVTGIDKPRGRGQHLTPTPVKITAQKYGLPLFQPEILHSRQFGEKLKRVSADLFVVVAFRILPENIIAIPQKGVVNLHASLLPQYRGAAPIQRALLNGENETGVTTFFIEKKVDTGAIILQEKINISRADTAGDLHDRLAHLGAEVLLKTVDLIDSGNPPVRKQEGEYSYASKITKEMCQIHWADDAEKIHNQIRAFSPVPGAFSYLGEKMLKVYRSKISQQNIGTSPGTIAVNNGRMFVAAKDKWLEILELQEQAKKRVKTEDYLRGKNPHALRKFTEK